MALGSGDPSHKLYHRTMRHFFILSVFFSATLSAQEAKYLSSTEIRAEFDKLAKAEQDLWMVE